MFCLKLCHIIETIKRCRRVHSTRVYCSVLYILDEVFSDVMCDMPWTEKQRRELLSCHA